MTLSRIFNFSAGPSMMPESVLERAAKEMLNYADSGMS
ncbi:MAG TPA: 3-phosphoserine/phosphohydroxythreonine aminotransferase, partial [Clostridiaceae bacterium]|nr:3-phosphoserine/phosphohydroxythreonine aminotransferase [Clostridiaceae bacterium]